MTKDLEGTYDTNQNMMYIYVMYIVAIDDFLFRKCCNGLNAMKGVGQRTVWADLKSKANFSACAVDDRFSLCI